MCKTRGSGEEGMNMRKFGERGSKCMCSYCWGGY